MYVTFSSTALATIRAHVAATRDEEACGLLLGRGEQVVEARPCRNVATEPARRFEIDPVQLLAAHREGRSGGLAVLGHYHSHPRGSPVPSSCDAAAAVPDGALWLIVGSVEVRLWRAVAEGVVEGRFDPVPSARLSCTVDAAVPKERVEEDARMTVSPVDLASLLCSRLCHDLLSPVGALNNGLELLADETDPAMRARCMELLAESARTSASKLKFFRLAFGAAGGFGEAVDVHEARQAIEALLAEGKGKSLNWMVEADTLPKAAVKVLLNLALIGGDALVRGGTVSIGAEENNGQVEIVVQGEGPRVLLDAEIERTLVGGEGDGGVTARTAAAYMIHTLVAERAGSIQASHPADGVLILGATLGGTVGAS